MTEDSEGAVDLLGDPWTDPPDPRGRKAHRRLPQVAERIAVLRAGGSTQEEIAAAIGLSVKTLAKYYSRELEEGPALARQVLLAAQWKKAMDGSTAAANFVRDELERGEARQAKQALDDRAGAEARPPARAVRKGKKEQRDDAAASVAAGGGKYAPARAPRLLIDNTA